MESTIKFKREEAVALKLRGLFEQRGFRRVSVNKFEEYNLYIDNRNFLRSEQIITFMDVDGKLLALKPDVTLSVVKNMPRKQMQSFEKLYYLDEVYRLSKENREYQVLSQIGVELIGPCDPFSSLEALDLALESLRTISSRYVLDISHLGFVAGLLEEAGLSQRAKQQLMACIHAKNTHDARRYLEQAGIQEAFVHKITNLCELHGSFLEVVPRARDLVSNAQMEEAYGELVRTGEVLAGAGLAEHVNLDFSVVNDVDYYNGLIFLGYVEGIPNVMLTGGRYDNLLSKMGNQNGAIGFAVYLSELGMQKSTDSHSDFHRLITYAPDADYARLLQEVRKLNEQGRSVRLEPEGCDVKALGFTYDRRLLFRNGRLEEGQDD